MSAQATTHATTLDSPSRPRTSQGRGANIALWAVQVLVAAAFLASAVAKFAMEGGDWFTYLIAVLEVAGAVGLLIPRLTGLAGLAFVGLMIGAVATHLFFVGGSPAPAIVLLVLAAVIAWGRRHSTAELFTSLRRLGRA